GCKLQVASCRFVARVGEAGPDEAGKDRGGLERGMKLGAEGTRGIEASAATLARVGVGTFTRWNVGTFGRAPEVDHGGLVIGGGRVGSGCRFGVVAYGAGDGLEEMADAFIPGNLNAEVAGFIEELGEVAAHVRGDGADDFVGGDAGFADALADV